MTSSLGQPLRMTIPLLGATGDSLDAQCFRIVTPTRSEGLTIVTQARVELQTSSSPPLLIVRGSRSIDDPVVRIAVEGGCDSPIRREYTVLLDPPPLRQDVAAAPVAITSPTPPVTATPTPTATDSTASGSTAASTPRSDRPRAQPRSAKSAPPNERQTGNKANASAYGTEALSRKAAVAAKTSAASPRDELRLQSGAGSSPPIEDASLAALAVPRLKISSDLVLIDPGVAPAPKLRSDELQSAIAQDRRSRLFATPIEEDLAPRLEADLVVAKRRLAELQAQLAAAGTANSASSVLGKASATEGGAKASPSASTATGDWRTWLWIPGLLLVLGLLWFLLQQRKKQQRAAFAATDPLTVVSATTSDDEFDTVLPSRTLTRAGPPTLSGELSSSAPTVAPEAGMTPPFLVAMPAAPQAAAEREASERLNNPLFQLSDTAPHLDVSELSHITDEAQVYADLGRNDQAIELLRAHIDEQVETDRSSPAPWLMIFDLYRRTNNRAGYDELAPRFRKNFNGRMPDWDNYGHELALDDGIEAFPHLVARIERDWGTPAARKFLDELLYDNRGGSRLGFSLAAYRDILLLMQVHDAMAPGVTAQAGGDWESRGADDNDGTPKWDLELDMIEPPKPGELDAFLSRPPADKDR